MKWKFLRLPSLIVIIFLLSACGNVEKIQNIEVFCIETAGYMKVNAISSIEEGKNYIKTDIKSIEDFYDREGNYIETEITHSTSTISKVTQVLNDKNRKKKLQKPSTILISDEDVENYKLENSEIESMALEYTLTEEERDKVKEHVLSFMNNF